MSKLTASGRAGDASVKLSAVIVVPTRELAHQITDMIAALQVWYTYTFTHKPLTLTGTCIPTAQAP